MDEPTRRVVGAPFLHYDPRPAPVPAPPAPRWKRIAATLLDDLAWTLVRGLLVLVGGEVLILFVLPTGQIVLNTGGSS